MTALRKNYSRLTQKIFWLVQSFWILEKYTISAGKRIDKTAGIPAVITAVIKLQYCASGSASYQFVYQCASGHRTRHYIFISTEGLSGWSRKELVLFLCNAGLLDTFGSNKEEVAPMTFEIEGRNGNRFLSINFLGDGDLRAYEGGYFLPFEALNDFNSTREPFPEPEPKPKPVRKPRTTTTAKPATKRRAKKKPATKKTPIITAPKKRGRPPKEKT